MVTSTDMLRLLVLDAVTVIAGLYKGSTKNEHNQFCAIHSTV